MCAVGVGAQKLFADAGAPEGVYTNFFVFRCKDCIVGHPKIKGVSLTGSESAGASVGERAGKHIRSRCSNSVAARYEDNRTFHSGVITKTLNAPRQRISAPTKDG
ncbi:aldehyde dehydrogenase family protein [Nocardia sp. NPDC049190]|uniref:aldehyde dehydrogenase family protein n=1 Tax=Nocardia sp. NPDC049190 TaxID=3155650 RepID=UPI0033E9B97C